VEEAIIIRRSEYEQLLSVIAELREKVQQLQEEVELLKNGRNSKTSSTAPSHDISRSNVHSLRRISGKKTGGQKGHPGHHLSMSDTSDTVIEHIPERCSCGHSLEGVTLTGQTRRQVIDIPPIKPHYTEHRSYHKICPHCGKVNRGVYPDEVSSPVQYGKGIKSMAGYMSVYQFLPYKRLSVFFRDVFSLPVSEGSIENMLEEMSQKIGGGIQDNIGTYPEQRSGGFG
jgi:transposase